MEASAKRASQRAHLEDRVHPPVLPGAGAAPPDPARKNGPPFKRIKLHGSAQHPQEDQLGALGLVLNVIVLWNTIYMDAALTQLRAEGYSVRDEDVARLSPLIHQHINMLGRYSFVVPEPVVRGELRPLRTPADDEP
jgi:hypothetical protein